MGFVATWSILATEGPNSGGEMTVRTTGDVDDLIKRLGQPGATAALLRHEARPTVADDEGGQVPDHDVSVGVWQGFGYLTYADLDHDYMTVAGDPASPAYPAHYVEYDPGTGVDLGLLARALVEFLQTGQRPTCVSWQEVE